MYKKKGRKCTCPSGQTLSSNGKTCECPDGKEKYGKKCKCPVFEGEVKDPYGVKRCVDKDLWRELDLHCNNDKTKKDCWKCIEKEFKSKSKFAFTNDQEHRKSCKKYIQHPDLIPTGRPRRKIGGETEDVNGNDISQATDNPNMAPEYGSDYSEDYDTEIGRFQENGANYNNVDFKLF